MSPAAVGGGPEGEDPGRKVRAAVLGRRVTMLAALRVQAGIAVWNVPGEARVRESRKVAPVLSVASLPHLC
jgi:hypothetical protein